MNKEDVLDRFAIGIQKFHNDLPINLIKRKLEWITSQKLENAMYMVKLDVPLQNVSHIFGLFKENDGYRVRFMGKEVEPGKNSVPFRSV